VVVYSPRWVPFALSSISADIAVDVPPKADESVSETAVEPNSASPAFVARDAACASRRLIAAAWPDGSRGDTPGERGGVRAVSRPRARCSGAAQALETRLEKRR
jgi:hypothetical protein